MRAVVAAAAVAAALVVTYLALGGASYAPAKTADPCAPREWREPRGLEAVFEQIVLSALDGAACELGVTREDVVLALESRESRARFAREHRIGNDELEKLTRAGLVRAITDAERATALDPELADVLRGIARRVPVSQLLGLLDLLPGE
ncbi:MAG: hypothetical protein ACRDNH_04870 [Gaiellaceae bacterium]